MKNYYNNIIIFLIYILSIWIETTISYTIKLNEQLDCSNGTNQRRPTQTEYMTIRQQWIQTQQNQSFESNIILNDREQLANEIIMKLKRTEIEQGIENPDYFTPAQHLFSSRAEIMKSPLYQLIRKMPKGGVLHAHATSMCSAEFMVNITYRDHLWQCNHAMDGKIIRFRFATNRPDNWDNCTWLSTAVERKRIGADRFDQQIRSLFILDAEERNINSIWLEFSHILDVTRSLMTYAPVWRDYYRQALREYAADNVQYLEFRGGSVNQVYDLNGNLYSPAVALQLYVDVLDEYKKENPNFFGSRYIYCPFRLVSDEKIHSYIKTILLLDELFPEFFMGFDFAGQEDRGRRLLDFVPYILQLPPHIKGYYHAGETNWFGETDENMIDAVMLGAKRIGHGYGLNKYPNLLKMIKERNIVIEVNPISNQVLSLVDDLRNHPAAGFFALNVPIIISSDNFPMWEATPMSMDYYLTFMGITSSHSDLRTLKKLVQNTIQYSGMNDSEKMDAFQRWHRLWDRFIDDIILENY